MAKSNESHPAYLEFLGADREFPLEGRELRIGRGPDCDVRVDDPTNTISGLHAVVRASDDGHLLVDESRNGTSVKRRGKGRPVALGRDPHSLQDGDVIVLMEGVELRFHDAVEVGVADGPSTTPSKKKESKGGNRGFLIGGAVMWLLVLGALALSSGEDDGEAGEGTITLTGLVAELEGDAESGSPEAVRALAEHVRSDETGWLRENVLAAAWAERRGDDERAINIWGQVYLRSRSPEHAHEALAAFARERLDALK